MKRFIYTKRHFYIAASNGLLQFNAATKSAATNDAVNALCTDGATRNRSTTGWVMGPWQTCKHYIHTQSQSPHIVFLTILMNTRIFYSAGLVQVDKLVSAVGCVTHYKTNKSRLENLIEINNRATKANINLSGIQLQTHQFRVQQLGFTFINAIQSNIPSCSFTHV